MTAYQEFVSNPNIEQGKIARLWEIEVNRKIDDIIDFTRQEDNKIAIRIKQL